MNPNQTHQGTSAVRTAVRLSLLASAVVATGFSYTAMAAAPVTTDTELEEVTVTGSLLRRTDAETPSPVTIISAESMEERGLNTLGETVQRLSANNAGTIGQGWNTGNNFASGAIAPALRGLSVQNTLSIADGLRLAPYPLADDGHRNFTDLSIIPTAIIDRVEVLRDGASSTYGADAIAGVVNVITKKEFQGFQTEASFGISQKGDGDETRVAVTFGQGDLAADGYNFYVSGEYSKQKAIWATDRGYPFNTDDWTGRCGESGSCMANLNWNGITPEVPAGQPGRFNGLFGPPGISLVRPVTTAGSGSGAGRFSYLNATAGCRDFPTTTISPLDSGTSPLNICEVNPAQYQMLQPDVEGGGVSMRFTTNINDDMQFYVMGNYYRKDSYATLAPRNLYGNPAAPNPAGLVSPNIILPVYVCAAGVWSLNGNNGCNATNGILNPQNPYAAAGQTAQIILRSPFMWTDEVRNANLRTVVGLEGSFGDGWRYTADFTASQVGMDRIQDHYTIPQRMLDAVAKGEFNFMDPLANSQDVWDKVSPKSVNHSTSNLWQIQATIAKDLFQLPGGMLQGALGASFRNEAIKNPSANPADPVNPYDRYLTINAVGAVGSRDVTSGFFELSAPVLDNLELMGSGRFDDYSSGQSNFSPKLGFKWTPFEQLAIRGTWSEGFRIPSFNEAFGLPTTGYTPTSVNCTVNAAYCAAHGNNAYATNQYSVGLTNTGNPSLDPEKSTSYTAGLVFQPLSNLSFTLDYWNIEIKDVIHGVAASLGLINSYYANGGVSTAPGITFAPGNPDPAFPGALPQLGFIQASFINEDQQNADGIDFAANFSMPIGNMTWRSDFDVSYLLGLSLDRASTGLTEEYAGTLSPCDTTSCSGAPEWRMIWQNALDIGPVTTSLTAYYTSGVDTASIDYEGIKGDCQFNADNAVSTAAYVDGSPVNCKSKDVWNVDLTAIWHVNDKLQVQGDILNVLDIPAPFDPSGGYGILGYQSSWAQPNAIGRFFRLGVKYTF